MARPGPAKTPSTVKTTSTKASSGVDTDFAAKLEHANDLANKVIKSANTRSGETIAFNLSEGNAPTIPKNWISTGSIVLDRLLSNKPNVGGYPEGRIIEISGRPHSGKSTLAQIACANVQKMGGLAIYIDSENATSPEYLSMLGVDTTKAFAYIQAECMEDVFECMEDAINQTRSSGNKDFPVLIVWDSVAASVPKAELEGTYEQNTIGLGARKMSQGLRKITGHLAHNRITMICVNQLKEKVGISFGDNTIVPYGHALPFHATIRLKLNQGSQKKDKDGRVIGITNTLKVIKNKVAPGFREFSFDIEFGKGVLEGDAMFDLLREHSDKYAKDKPIMCDGYEVKLEGAGGWKNFTVFSNKTGEILIDKKFHKPDFMNAVVKDPECSKYFNALLDDALIIDLSKKEHITLSKPEGFMEEEAFNEQVKLEGSLPA